MKLNIVEISNIFKTFIINQKYKIYFSKKKKKTTKRKTL